MGRINRTGYSSKVEMRLIVAGNSFDVVQSCSDRLFLAQEERFSPEAAEVGITVNGQADSHPVRLYCEPKPTRGIQFR